MNTMRRKADREKEEGPSQQAVERQQRAMQRLWVLFRVVIGVLGACALGAAWMGWKVN